MTGNLIAVFLAEVRTARRLARTWLLAFLAAGTTLVGYLFFAGLHGEMSSFIPAAVTSPRFQVASFGGYLLWFVLAAMVFLAFDIGNRERRERIADAFDTRPASNIQIVAGRLAGIVATVVVPMAIAVATIQAIGTIGHLADWRINATFEPVSLAVFLVVDALPALVLWGAVVFLLAAIVRSRLVVAIIGLGMLGLAFWSLSHAPAWLLPYVAIAPDRLVSDLVSSIPDVPTVVHRISLVLLAAGVVIFAALCLPRPDATSLARRLMVATAFVGVGIAGIAAAVGQARSELTTRAQWQAAQQHVSGAVRDIRSVVGEVHIDPGVSLGIDVVLTVAVPHPVPASLMFRFNPGMQVTELRLGDQPIGHDHRDGLLRTELPAAVGDVVTLHVRAAGIPDPDFAYLDSAIDFRTVVGANPWRDLGTDASLFDRRYVALMPGVHWLPGTVATPTTPAATPRDHLDVDLVVQVPEPWLVAGPGRREALQNGRYRFRPKVPVTEIGLVAANFERRVTSVRGIELELLASPRHASAVEFFADTGQAINELLADIVERAAGLGLDYPLDALRLVEAPARLRGYRGGWQMGTSLALPGVLLFRERSFPTANFFTPDPVPDNLADTKINSLRRFFADDRSGADSLAGFAHHLFRHQTGARGPGAVALDYVCQALVARLLDDTDSYFSAHIYAASPTIRSLLADSLTSALTGGSGQASTDMFAAVRPPSVWHSALGAALADLDTTDPAQAVNILTLKGDAVARTILDGLGRDTTARLLAELRNEYQGTSFTAADFDRVATEVGADLPALLGDWLHDAALPGFVTSAVSTVRLADDDNGEPRYQLRVNVFNGEAVPGVLRLRYRFGDDAAIRESDPVRVAGHQAMEVGLVTKQPIRELWVVPYLSLNRHEFPVRVPDTDTSTTRDATPHVGAMPSPWRRSPGAGMVVDDLDPGFSVRSPVDPRGADSGHGYDSDEGLPVYQRIDPLLESFWSRQEQPTSWGRYRHTIARVTPGDGDREAVFTATLPDSGRWRVDYHLPNLDVRYPTGSNSPFRLNANVEFTESTPVPQLGNYQISLVSGERIHPVEFDASTAQPGWTTLGRFDLHAGDASLVVSNRTDGRSVVADAVRWIREEGSTVHQATDG